LTAQSKPNVIYAGGDTSITSKRIEGLTIGRTIQFHRIDNWGYRTMVLTDNMDTIRIIIDKDTIYTKEYYLKEFIKRYFRITEREEKE